MRLKDLSFISNQMSGALISLSGEVVWCTMPRFDSSPIFSKLLDEEKGGSFDIKIQDEAKISQRYTAPNILETTFETIKGTAKITDFMPFGQSALIREVESSIDLEISLSPTFDYGRSKLNAEVKKDGIKFTLPGVAEGIEVKTFGLKPKINGSSILIKPGKGYIYLLYSQDVSKGLFSEKEIIFSYPKEGQERSIKYWEHLLPKSLWESSNLPGEGLNSLSKIYSSSISAILGLFFAPSGAPVSAPTTSLPEAIGESRNWDYRFIWVRDSCIMSQALIRAGLPKEGKKIIQFLMRIMDFSGKPFSQPVYELDGSSPTPERTIDWLSGFNGSKPVRVGNSAYKQVQLDVEGFFINALYTYYSETKDKAFLSESIWAVEYCADWVSKNWKLSDAGLWEESEKREFTFSKVMMWSTLDKAGKIAIELGMRDRWHDKADEIKKWIMENCTVNGYFSKYPGTDQVDAALLNIPIVGFIEATNPLFSSTLKKIEKDLVLGGYVFRYRHDSMGEAKHPFSLCSGWLSQIYALEDRNNEAIGIIQNLAKIGKKSGLVGEHVDVENEDFLGNYPQGFAHAGIILAINEIKNSMGLKQLGSKDTK